MSISEKIKTINDKIEQNKSQYSLDKQTAKISALLSGNVTKYEFLTSEDVLPEKGLLGKAAKMKQKKKKKRRTFSIRQRIKSTY